MSIDKLTDKIAEIATALQGPGFEAARQAARVEAYSSLVSGAVCGVIAVGIGFALRWLFKREFKDEHDGDFIRSIAAVIGSIALGFLVPIAVWSFVDPWVWATLSQPELWLAKKALKL